MPSAIARDSVAPPSRCVPMLRGHQGLGMRMDRLDSRMDGLAEATREVRDRRSRLEGKVDFLEGYIVRRNEAGAPAE